MDLNELRIEIDKVDSELLPLLEKRMELAEAVGKYKFDANLPIEDLEREKIVLSKLPTDSPYVREIFEEIIKVSKKCQFEVKE